MTHIFKTILNMMTYKPKADEPFELLEDSIEGEDKQKPQQNAASQPDKGDSSKKQEGRRETKVPLSVDEWNKAKTREDRSTSGNREGMVSKGYAESLQMMKDEFGVPTNTDVIIREFKVARKRKAFIVYMDGMVDRTFVSDFILRQLMEVNNFTEYFNEEKDACILDYINDNVISAHETGKMKNINNITYQILNGDTALFIDMCDECMVISTRGYEKRSVDKPVTENVIMGSHEGFTENLRTNITLVRKIIKNKSLKTEMMKIGRVNQSYCAILYLEGITNPQLIEEVRKRLQCVDADFVAGDGMLVQYIEDSPFMILPQVLHTERPDRTASFLVEGQVIIMMEGAPFAEAVPVTFFRLLHTSEDSFLRWQYGTFLRYIRVFGVIVTTALPALYVAITLFHQEMIPTELLSSIARSKERVPFPTLIEILMLEVAFELIREGGIRVPGVIGQTLGIIGALILGQAAVAAGLVSPILIIIVAVTGLGSFTIPNYSLGLGLRILRFMYLLLAATFGFYGISMGFFLTGCMACSMKSFGVPFFSPVAPKTKLNPDVLTRMPIWKQKQRPDYLNPLNRKRQKTNVRDWKKSNGGENGS